MNAELLRIVDGICRDKNIERETFLTDLAGAIAAAVRKQFNTENVQISLDPLTGQIACSVDGAPIDANSLGRIAAQNAKQVIMQRTRERERTSILEEFTERVGTIVTGTVTRIEGGNLLVNIGRTEGFLPRSEQIPGETHQVGERIRVMILEVREQPNQVKIILSRSHRDFIVRLFEVEVPEVAERIIEIKAIAREAGYRTKVAVSSIDSKVDAVGACVGVRGSRIKNIVDELNNEKIDIVRWNESSQILIQNALKPAEVQEIALCLELGKATVVVADDQLSLAIGKRGQNVRLAARLTGWDIDILTPGEYNKNLETMERILRSVEGVDDLLLDRMVAMGCVSVTDIDEIESASLTENLDLAADLVDRMQVAAGEEVIRIEEEKEQLARDRAAGLIPPEGAEQKPAEPADSAFVADAAATADAEAGSDAEPTSGAAGASPSADADASAAGESAPSAVATEEAAPQAAAETPTGDDEQNPSA